MLGLPAYNKRIYSVKLLYSYTINLLKQAFILKYMDCRPLSLYLVNYAGNVRLGYTGSL